MILRSMTRRLRGLSALALAAAQAACYSYHAAELATVPTGEPVRLWLSERGLARLDSLGLPEAVRRDATVEGGISRRDGRLILSVPLGGGSGPAVVQELPLEPDDILRVESRRLDGVKTAIASVGAVALSAATVILIIGDAEGGPRLPGPGGPDDSRIP